MAGRKGFTLIEVLLALVIATLVVGGVMGSLSGSLRLKGQLARKREVWPVLETAAEKILARPALARDRTLRLDELPGGPAVEVRLVGKGEIAGGGGTLARASLRYKGDMLEFSIILPPE
jgi:prepilin-type N-terminal cleavage/methylation domain-containing protein